MWRYVEELYNVSRHDSDRHTSKVDMEDADTMGFLPDTYNCGLRMRQECQERFPRHRLQRKPLVSDPVMHHGTCVTHVS